MAGGDVNLVDFPWIPVTWLDSERESARLGLRDLFVRAPEIRGLRIAEAPAHAALLRVLYALTARITGLDEAPGGADKWILLRQDVLENEAVSFPRAMTIDGEPGGIEGYFDRERERFGLFHPEHPWMQDPRLPQQCDATNTAGVNKLVMSRASGNNHSWFSHDTEDNPVLPDISQAVLSLLTWHYWGASGRCSKRTVGDFSDAGSRAAPLRGVLSYHPECSNLFRTLLAGLTPPEKVVSRKTDLCAWERDELTDPLRPMPYPQGPCSRLTAVSQHAVYLVPAEDRLHVADAYITWAYRAERLRSGDDYLILDVGKKDTVFPRAAEGSRSLWRDVDALLLKQEADRPRRPTVMDHAFDIDSYLRVRALGFDQEVGKATNYQYVESVTPVLLSQIEEDAADTDTPVRRLRELGEEYGSRLEDATKTAWREYTDDKNNTPGAWLDAVAARYWPAAEDEFWARFRKLTRTDSPFGPDGLDREDARLAFRRHALAAYDEVTDSVTRTPRGAKAVNGQARAILLAKPKNPQK